MIQRTPTIFAALLVATLAIAPASHAATAPATNISSANDKLTELFGDPLIAKGPGVEVKRSQLDTELVNIKSRLASMRQNYSPDQMAVLERQALDGLITFQLVLAKATTADKEKG